MLAITHSMGFLLALFVTYSEASPRPLLVSLGLEKSIPATQSSIWVENKKYLRVERNGRKWVLRGLSEGTTFIREGMTVYEVQIVHPSKKELLFDLQNFFQNQIGLNLHFTKNQIIVDGQLYRFEEWVRLAQIFQTTQQSYAFQAQLSDEIQTQAQDYFKALLVKNGLLPFKIDFADPAELKLSPQQSLKKNYEALLRPFGVAVRTDSSYVDIQPIVKIQMTVLEINTNLKMKYGVKWPDSLGAQVYPSLQWDHLTADLDLLQENGEAKLLASPNLLSRSGKESTFLVGGEFPISVKTRSSKTVLWKKYGISMKFKPKADSLGRMSLSIETEVSSLDHSLILDGVPALKTHSVSSQFDLMKSELIALSGLLKQENGKNSQGWLGLSALPILGTLFKSDSFLENKSELVILVKPEIFKQGTNRQINQHLRTESLE